MRMSGGTTGVQQRRRLLIRIIRAQAVVVGPLAGERGPDGEKADAAPRARRRQRHGARATVHERRQRDDGVTLP